MSIKEADDDHPFSCDNTPLQAQLDKLAKNAAIITEQSDSSSDEDIKPIKKPIADSIL